MKRVVLALLAVLLASGRMFQDDLRSGWVDQWVLTCAATGTPLALLVAARLAAQWLLAALPVLAVAPLVALQFGLGAWPLAVLMASLALGTAVLVLITGVAAALILRALGVPLPVLMQDYLLTNQLYRPPSDWGDAASTPAGLQVLWRVQEDFLEAALHGVEVEYGGIAPYLERVLGINPAAQQRLSDLYLQR